MRDVKTQAPITTATETEDDTGAHGGTFVSLRLYPLIRWLWTGTIATNTAFWMYQVALGWLALQLTDSAFWVGLAGFAGGIPILIFALPAGVVVDRFNRRTVLMAGQVGVMVSATLFSILIGTGLMNRWVMLVLACCYGSSMAFVFPTRHAIIGRLVEPRDLPNAIALNSAGQNATRVFGPSLAGLLIAVIGISGTFAFAAALQIFALGSSLKLPSARPRSPGKRGPVLHSFTEGLRYVSADPALYGTIILATVGTVLIMPYITMMPVFAQYELDLGATGLGLLLTAVGIGSVLGALFIAGAQWITTRSGAQVVLLLAWVVTVLIFAFTPWVWIAMPILFLTGVLSAGFLATNLSILQLRSDDEIRGRVLSVNQITWGLLPVGQLPLGLLADHFGAPLATGGACMLAFLAIALIVTRVPELRRGEIT
ncbi:MAG: MFS transporter [Chloroflexota bacterium]